MREFGSDPSMSETQEMPPVVLGDLPRFKEIGHGFNTYNALRGMNRMDMYGGDYSNPPRRAGFYLQAKKAELTEINNALAGGKTPNDVAGEVSRWIAQAQAVEVAWFKPGSQGMSFKDRGLKEQLPATHEELQHYGNIHHAITSAMWNLDNRGQIRIEVKVMPGKTVKEVIQEDLDGFMKIMDKKFIGETITDDERQELEEVAKKYG